MSLSRVGGSSAAANSIAIPTHVAGDLIVIWAYRDGSTTPPTVPTAGGTVPTFTTIDGPTGANACSAVCAWAVAAGTTDTSGTWTNATGLSVEVWRGQSSSPIGGHAQSGASVASGANIAIPAITLTDASGNSAILAFAGWQTVTAWNAAPAGYTQQSQVATECEALSKTTTTTDGTFNVTGTASATGGTRTQQIEIIAKFGNRVSQDAVEVLYNTTAAQARVSQVAIEALTTNPSLGNRTSQVAVEILLLDQTFPPFISSVTAVHAPALVGQEAAPFIASVTVVYAPTLAGSGVNVPFIASVTVVYAPSIAIQVPFISNSTVVYPIMSVFDPNKTFGGPGNGGEAFMVELNANGVTTTATLAADIGVGMGTMTLTGDSGLPDSVGFVVAIDSEQIYVFPRGGGSYAIHGRGVGNTTVVGHTAGATVSWGDTYQQAILSTVNIDGSFTADITGSGSTVYPGWLICFDSSQAYLSGDRYPMHVTSVLGVFAAGAGTSGTNHTDGAQPNAISTPTGTSDDCPASLSNPSRISSNITAGDVAVVEYTNPESVALDLGPRSVALQSWFGLKRVDLTDNDVTFTDPNGIVVDTTGTYDTFTGSVNGEWFEPNSIGIAPITGLPTPNPVPYTSVTLPGTDRKFTFGSGGGGYDEKGWPMACLAVRQGNKRVPFWQSWDWHNYSYVYTGFGTDATYAQILINRNGIIFGSVPEVELPGPQDIDGPDAVWDDKEYYFGASWYVVIFAGPYLVVGPVIGGTGGVVIPDSPSGFTPGVEFPSPGSPSISVPSQPTVEGGSGGGIGQPPIGLHIWATSGKGFS